MVFDPLAASFFEDPYPVYEALRRDDPVHRSARSGWAVSRYDDVVDALGDARLGNAPSPIALLHARNAARYTSASVASQILPFQDPPLHTTSRKVVALCFKEQVKDPSLSLPTAAERQLAACGDREELDVLADFATPYAVRVMCDFMGFDRADLPQLEAWSDAFFYLLALQPSPEKRAQVDAELQAFRGYVSTLLHARSRTPKHDLLTHFARACTLGGGELTVEAAVDNCMLVFADGIENVDRGIANCVRCLLMHPAQWRALCEDPALIAGAVEESLRFESPAQFIARTAQSRFELHGRTIREGETVLLLLGSANRDARTFETPDRFDIRRTPNPHLAFGRGRHACLGGGLATDQIHAAIAALAKRFPTLTLTPAPTRWLPRAGHRWLAELRVAR